MAVINLYNGTYRGAIIMTGNSNGISTAAGTQIGGFSIGLPTNTPPTGTTTPTSSINSSSARITIPSTATVMSAFLLWSAQASNGGSSIGNGNQNNNISLRDPLGNTTSITPAVPYRQVSGTIAVGPSATYSNAADVTSIVKSAGSGFYTVGGVLGIIGSNGEYNGWILMVAYEDPTEPFRNINMWTLLNLVQGGVGGVVDITISGFSTPSSGPTPGKIIISSGNGNAELSGESTLFGPNVNALATLSGPNNPATNFFASQINDNNGNLDKTGTFGNANSTPGSLTPAGSRNNWDVTRVDATPGLTNNQTSGIIRFRTVQDTLFITGVGLQVDVNSANLTPVNKTVNKPYADRGDILVYTITTVNAGLVTANNAVFIDTIPTGTTFEPESLYVNDVLQTGQSPAPPGINIGNISPNQLVTIRFSVKTSVNPIVTPVTNVASFGYNFIPANGLTSITSSSGSSVVTTTILTGILSSSKSVDKEFVKVGDIITYTVTLSNSGTTTVDNIVFIDTIPNDTSLVSNTFKQGTTLVSGSPNPPGATLPNTIGPNAISTVTFQVVVNTIPSPNPIPNTATATYKYTINATTTPNTVGSGSTNTNTVNTRVNTANVSNISKSVDKAFASVGDVITYLITIPNSGSITANNVVFTDTIPNGTSFVANSVKINGATQNGQVVTPPTGVTLPDIGVNSFVTLSFEVKVTTFPVPNPIPNTATVKSTYTVDPTLGTTSTASGNTNFVYTQVNTATITSTKSVSPSNVLVGGTINYTIVLRNTGNTTAQNVVFTDTIPNGTSFVSNSLKVNGVTNPNSPAPPTGINLSDMGPNAVQTVTFSVTATTIPTPNPTPNSATTNFNYVLNTITGGTIPSSSNSNTVTAYVNPESNPLKIVDKQYATLGDTLKYTIVWRNVISVAESNVTLVDTIPSGTTFVPGSITISGGSQTGTTITPPNGLNVGTVPVGSAVTVTFNVTVNTIPTVNPIPNEVTAGYDFISDPTLGTVTHDTSLSNTVTTQVNLATISSATKTVDKDFAKVGDILEYTVVFNNTGNVTANNIVLIDTIPSGTSFIINSVKINEVIQPGGVVAPPTGLSVGTLGSGATTTVKFQVTVITIPIPNPIPNTAAVGYNFEVDPNQGINKAAQINTNTVNTKVNFADITSPVKTVNKAYANISDTLVYTIALRNTGNATATNIVFIDTIPNDTTLVPNTFKQDSTNIAGSPNSPGVTLPNSLAPGTTTTITFNVTVNTIPSPNPIPNNASQYYSYVVDPTLNTTAIGSGNTNTVLTTVNNASLANIYKSVDKPYATCGEILTYTITIPNSGNTAAFNVVLRDTIPTGTSFVSNSVTVNSVTQPVGTNPQTGITVGTISVGAIATVTFQVKVNC